MGRSLTTLQRWWKGTSRKTRYALIGIAFSFVTYFTTVYVCHMGVNSQGTIKLDVGIAEIWIRPNYSWGDSTFMVPVYKFFGPQKGLSDEELEEMGVTAAP